HSGAVASADCFQTNVRRQIEKVRRLSPCVRVGFAHEIVADQTDGEGASGNHEQDLNSGRENSQECNFDGERLLDIAAEMVAQFLQAPNAVQNFGGGEALCQRSSFLFGRRQVPAIYICACSQNIRPPLEQNFDERGTALEIKTLGQSFVIFLAFIKPGAVGRILVASFFKVQ